MNIIETTSTIDRKFSKSRSSQIFRRCSLFLDNEYFAIDDSEIANEFLAPLLDDSESVDEMWENGISVFDSALPKENSYQVTSTSLNKKGREPSLSLGFDFDTLDEDERRGSVCFTEFMKSDLEARDSTSKENLKPLNKNSIVPFSLHHILANKKDCRVSNAVANYFIEELRDTNPKPKKSLESLNEKAERAHSLALGFGFNVLESYHQPSMTFVKPINCEIEARGLTPRKSSRVPKRVELPRKNTSNTAKTIFPSGQYYETLSYNLFTSMKRSAKSRREVKKMNRELTQNKNRGFLSKGKATKRRPRTYFPKHIMCS